MSTDGPIFGGIDMETFIEFEARTPGTEVCSCLIPEAKEWGGGEHLVSEIPGTRQANRVTRAHYYPNRGTQVIHMLKIETVPLP